MICIRMTLTFKVTVFKLMQAQRKDVQSNMNEKRDVNIITINQIVSLKGRFTLIFGLKKL